MRPYMQICALLLSSMLFTTAYAGKYNAVTEIGDPMPSFTDLPTVDGRSLSSPELKESVIVLVSLANHCPWVRGMDHDLIKLVNQFKDQDVRIVGFSVSHREADRLAAMKKHAEKVGYNFTYLYDESQELGRKLGATHTPEYFVFDRDRKLVYMGLLYNSPARMIDDGRIHYLEGPPSQFYVQDAIQAALNGKPVAIAETRAHGCTVKYEN